MRWRDGRGQRSRTFTRKADADRFKVDVERQAQLGSLYEEEPVFFSDFLAGMDIARRAGSSRFHLGMWMEETA